MVPSRSALDHSLPANFTLLNGKAHISKTKRYQGTREYTAHSSKYIRRWQSPEKEIAISTMQNYSNYEFNRCGKTNFRCLVVRPGSSDGRASDLEIRRSQSRNLPGSFVSSIKYSTMEGGAAAGACAPHHAPDDA